MRFESPWLWLLLPPLLLWVLWLGRRSYAQLEPAARWASMVTRAVMLTALIGALARPALVKQSDHQHAIFLLDVSRSISAENLDAALNKINDMAKAIVDRGHGDRITAITFGAQPRILAGPTADWSLWSDALREQMTYQTSLPNLYTERTKLISQNAAQPQLEELETRIKKLEEFRDTVAGETTDIVRAVRLALNCGDVEEARSIYLFSDGNFTGNTWEEAWRIAASQDTPVQTITLDKPIPPEVAAADLIAPPSVRVNQGFSADLHVASTIATKAKAVLYKDGYASAEISLDLRAGDNLVKIPGLFFREKGFHTIDVAIRAEQDTKVENNTVKSMVIVPGEARVLYVDADEAQQSYLKSALELEGMQVDARPAAGVPQSLAELLGYDAFILSNVPADRVSMRQMQLIKTYVQDFGGGFIMLGGENSFGLGGYFNTPIEEILPVKMPIQKDMLRPSLALMLVIDKSGSMDGVKIQLAKRAAIATADAINPRDQIGVVGFDGQSRVVLELTAAGDRGTIMDSISMIEAGGGTFLYPALEDAHERLTQSNARRKHVIVLSDGQTQGFGYPEFGQMMAGDGITMSTVGIGEGADMQLMEAIANAAGGRAYFTNDFHTIPQIFTREALRASKSMLVERLVQPMVNEDDEAIAELDDELPPLTGYVATTAKELAKVVIMSDAGDPLLAKWRSGLGRTAAFTSETKPRWAEDWIRWPDFAKFWTQLVRSVAGQELDENMSIEPTHELHHDAVKLTIDVRDGSGNFITDRDIELSMHDSAASASAATKKLNVTREAPGLFSAIVPSITYGRNQQFAWQIGSRSESEKPAEASIVPFGFVYSFSPEFRTLGVNEQTLEQIRERGHSVTALNDVIVDLPQRTSIDLIRLWPALLIVAIGLAPIDILLRRLG
jgi:Ca-activated chloride channel homolog